MILLCHAQYNMPHAGVYFNSILIMLNREQSFQVHMALHALVLCTHMHVYRTQEKLTE